jgi:hypothetical protein
VTVTERQLQLSVLVLARLRGFAVAHFRPGRTLRGGWRTPVAADGAGWPDLVLVKDNRCLFRELKGDGGRLRPEQVAWIARLIAAGQDARIWTATDWRDGTIDEELR